MTNLITPTPLTNQPVDEGTPSPAVAPVVAPLSPPAPAINEPAPTHVHTLAQAPVYQPTADALASAPAPLSPAFNSNINVVETPKSIQSNKEKVAEVFEELQVKGRIPASTSLSSLQDKVLAQGLLPSDYITSNLASLITKLTAEESKPYLFSQEASPSDWEMLSQIRALGTSTLPQDSLYYNATKSMLDCDNPNVESVRRTYQFIVDTQKQLNQSLPASSSAPDSASVPPSTPTDVLGASTSHSFAPQVTSKPSEQAQTPSGSYMEEILASPSAITKYDITSVIDTEVNKRDRQQYDDNLLEAQTKALNDMHASSMTKDNGRYTDSQRDTARGVYDESMKAIKCFGDIASGLRARVNAGFSSMLHDASRSRALNKK